MAEYTIKYDGTNLLRTYKDGKELEFKTKADWEAFKPSEVKNLLERTIDTGIIEATQFKKPKIKSIEVKVITDK